MNEELLIKELNVLFGRNRNALRKRLLDVSKDISLWERMGRDIRKQTKQPVHASIGLFEETLANLNNPKVDMFFTGDASYYYQIVLNSGIKNGWDWDGKLACKCGGQAKLGVVWASLLMPYYALDTYIMKYNTDPGEFEFIPYTPAFKREKKLITIIQQVLKNFGFKRMTKKLAKQIVPNAITDCEPRGKATVFDCLFSDTQNFQEHYVRFSDDFQSHRIEGAFKGTDVSWFERIGRNGRVIERYTSREFSSGDHVTTHLDQHNRIVKVSTFQRDQETKEPVILSLDVRKQKLKKTDY